MLPEPWLTAAQAVCVMCELEWTAVYASVEVGWWHSRVGGASGGSCDATGLRYLHADGELGEWVHAEDYQALCDSTEAKLEASALQAAQAVEEIERQRDEARASLVRDGMALIESRSEIERLKAEVERLKSKVAKAAILKEPI